MRVPWTVRRSNQPILKEISLEYPLEGLMLKLKIQYFGHLMQITDSLEKTLMLGKIEGRRRGRQRMNEMVAWHHRLDGHEFEQAPGVGDGQGSLACCSPWGRKELDMTEQLNNQEMRHHSRLLVFRILSHSRGDMTQWVKYILNVRLFHCPTLIVKVNINNSYLIQLITFSTLDLRSPLHTFPMLFLPLCSESIVSPSAYR